MAIPGARVNLPRRARYPVAALGRERSARPPPLSSNPSELHFSALLTLLLMVFGQREGVINYATRYMGLSTYLLVGIQYTTR